MPHEQASLAAVAARIIVESELTDWALARRKAATELGLPARSAPLPTDEQIISEIKTYHALYGGEIWAEQLRAQREFALVAMDALLRFNPILLGSVAEGWAHAGSEIKIEVTPDNPKTVEYLLIDLGVDFEPHQTRDGVTSFEIVEGDWPMRIIVRTLGRAPDTRHRTRLNVAQLRELLSA